MKKRSIFLLVFLISIATIFSSFSKVDNNQSAIDPPTEFEILLEYLKAQSNLLNGEELPIIKAELLRKDMKNPKVHIIDIRSESWFEYGHIKNAVNVASNDLPAYFKDKINPSEFDKIVLVCYSGQSAAYYAGLLRLAGYDNVYSMKWGMSSWREDFAEGSWLKNIGSDYASKLDNTEKVKENHGNHPVLNTGETDPKKILEARLQVLFTTPYKDYIIESLDLFENPDNYYIVNYWDETKCEGHIPGALHYHPNASLADDLLTLPIDEKVVVYEETGQKAAYVVAYLNVLGYDTGNVAYGANSFMNSVLKEKGWDAFTKKEINMFPVIE